VKNPTNYAGCKTIGVGATPCYKKRGGYYIRILLGTLKVKKKKPVRGRKNKGGILEKMATHLNGGDSHPKGARGKKTAQEGGKGLFAFHSGQSPKQGGKAQGARK